MAEPKTNSHGHKFVDHRNTEAIRGVVTDEGHRFLHEGWHSEHVAPPEPDQGVWTIDRYGAISQKRGSGWGEPGIMPFGQWNAMWGARGPLLECGPWGAPLDLDIKFTVDEIRELDDARVSDLNTLLDTVKSIIKARQEKS